ncbi:MAG: aminotransferase class IV family protein [Chloroflexi bacterium]|nr:aminotransferase class IV family protein [Chloroflexota bacterium]
MPAIIKILTPNGLQEANYTADSLADAGHHEPDGIYTITRTYKQNYALLFDSHLDRMEESARLENIPLQLDRAVLRTALRTMLNQAGYENVRFRVTVPRHQPDHLILTIEPFAGWSPEMYEKGVMVATVHIARHNPGSKTNDWVTQREAASASIPATAFQGIIVNDEGELLEGFSTNFYTIKGGKLYTAGEGVLGGISRKIVLQVAPTILPLELHPIKIDEIPTITESFVTSASRGIVPVVQIDEHIISDGKPGALTQQLRAAYLAWEESHLEPI